MTGRLSLTAALTLAMMPFSLFANSAQEISTAANYHGGIVVHLDSNGSTLSTELASRPHTQLQVLESNPDALAASRTALFKTGDYGQASAMRYDGTHLPYIDNMINLIVCTKKSTVPHEEILRVLKPLGTAHINGALITKPWPDEIDEWNHFLHGPDNNAVANDTRINQPRTMQWVSGPKWGRTHEGMASMSAMVTAQGRMFTIMDEAPLASIRFNSSWNLVARDAFNGALLWQRKIPIWNDHLRHFRSGPVHLPRRLIAIKDKVYVTLGLGAPVSELDARSGKTLKTFSGTEFAEELIYDEDVLYMVVGSSEVYRQGGGLHERKEPSATDFRFIAAYSPTTGKQLWKRSMEDGDFLLPQTIATKGRFLCYQSTFGMGCLDVKTGEVLWTQARPSPARRMGFSSPTLVMTSEVVLCADREATGDAAAKGKVVWGVNGWNEKGFARKQSNIVRAFALEDGKQLWQAPGGEGYNSPVDIFVIKNVAYISKSFTGHDIKTGKVIKTIDTSAPGVSMPHPRCHRYKATSDFIITGRSGVEYLDLEQGKWVGNNSWLRGTCQYGIMPANGIVYVPPDACGCNPTVKVPGIFAAASQRTKDGHINFPDAPVLVTGPAYKKVTAIPAGKPDWPAYRHDVQRSGTSPVTISASIKKAWSTKIGGKLTQATLVGDSLFLASVNAYTVYSLSQATGDIQWSFTANARVDSAPSYYKGYLIFGSADGWLYSVEAKTGRLAWKFMAAPEERLVNVYGRMESLWPVHGAALVQNDAVCITAGRSTYMDGGIVYYQIDPISGNQLSRKVFYDLDRDTGAELTGEKQRSFDMAGTSSDILTGDGTRIYLKHLALTQAGLPAVEANPHLYSVTGMLDEEWFVRAYWRYGIKHGAGWSRWAQAGNEVPFGRILCVDGDKTYGYGRGKVIGGPKGHETDSYQLFSSDSTPPPADPLTPERHKDDEKNVRRGKQQRKPKPPRPTTHWANTKSITVKAMAVSQTAIITAGPVDEGKKTGHLAFGNPEEALAAFEGKKDVFLQMISKEDGHTLFELKIDENPGFDGLSITQDKIFVTGISGTINCYTP